MAAPRTVALVTLGCARNEVDSEELAGRLEAGGWTLVDDAADADVAVVNTCGFVEQAKKDSIDTLLEASDAEVHGPHPGRRGRGLPGRAVRRAAGRRAARGRRGAGLRLLRRPVRPPGRDPARRPAGLPRPGGPAHACCRSARSSGRVPAARAPGHASGSGRRDDPRSAGGHRAGRAGPASYAGGWTAGRGRRSRSPPAATGAAPSAPSRRSVGRSCPDARPTSSPRPGGWRQQGVRELFLVSENSTSYGKDLGDLRLLETLLPELAAVEGVARVRVSYLQPAEVRPGLLDVMCGTDGVAPYFDLSFQHASGPLLRRMRRFGDRETLPRPARPDPVASAARRRPVERDRRLPGRDRGRRRGAARRSSTAARLDVVGVFGYSDEDGTEAEGYDGKVDPAEIADRVAWIGDLVEELTAQRAQERGRRDGRGARRGGGRRRRGRGPGRAPGSGRRRNRPARAPRGR